MNKVENPLFKHYCGRCGGIDYADYKGMYAQVHECENLNTNQLLLRIAIALEAIEKELK